jgi:hypothetical protein
MPKANGMSTLEIDVGDIRPVSVAFTTDELVVTLADGRRIATPLKWYPRLWDASASARGRFELMPLGIHSRTGRRPRYCRDAAGAAGGVSDLP